MANDLSQLEDGIRLLEAQRAVLGERATDAALAGLRASLALLRKPQTGNQIDQELRQVTILFLDVVGSTAFSKDLDPEAIGTVMDNALRRCTDVVRRHAGRVMQYAGDGLLAVFGADEVLEDDAERCVRCGLALLDLGGQLKSEVQSSHAYADFGFRLGVHTGAVLLGGGVDDGSIRGMPVNIAARMEQTAPAGSLRISHDSYVHVRGMFDVEAQPPLFVKGVDVPVQSYLVLSSKLRSFRIASRGIEGVATSMIGRDAEFDRLKRAFHQLVAERRLVLVTVVAEAGVGKSRLLNEFEIWSESRPEAYLIFRGRATPQMQVQPYGLLRDILSWRFQIADDDTTAVTKSKLEAGVSSLLERGGRTESADDLAHLLGHLVGFDLHASPYLKGILDDPKQLRNLAFNAAAQMFRHACADGDRIILALEDLHWADNESLDFLNYLSEVSRDIAMLVLASTRPDLFERRTDWRSTEGIHERIDLTPLDKTGSRLLADELLKRLPAIPSVLRESLIGGAEGNPYYMEELVKMLIDQGAITTGETWNVNADKLLASRVPASLTGVLQARIDRLSAAERKALQCASVIGSVFWDRALSALDDHAEQALPVLLARALIVAREAPSPDGIREYAFRHQLLHQVVYDTVLKRTKRDLHGRLARWLTSETGLRSNDFLGVAAEHHARAGDVASAIEYHARAAEHAQRLFAHDALLQHVKSALELLSGADPVPQAGDVRWRLFVARESTWDKQGKRDSQRLDIDAMHALAEQTDDGVRRAHVSWRRSVMSLRMADWEDAERSGRRGAELAARIGNVQLKLRCQSNLASCRLNQGDLDGAERIARELLAEAIDVGYALAQAHGFNVLAGAASARDDVVEAISRSRQSLRILREIGDRVTEGIGRINLGLCLVQVGAFPAARVELEEAQRLMRAHGYRGLEATVLRNLSTLAQWEGDDVKALALARAAVEMAVTAQLRDSEAECRLRLGDAELALGRVDESAQAFEQAEASASELGIPARHAAVAGLASVALARGDIGAALRHVDRIERQVADGGLDGVDEPRRLELTCYRVLALVDRQRAMKWLSRAHEALQITAAKISDAGLRQTLLNRLPYNREIVSLWALRNER